MTLQNKFVLTNVVELYGIGLGKTYCAIFYANVFFSARAKRMSPNGCRGAHERLRVINQVQLDSKRVVLSVVFDWNLRNEVCQR